MQREGECGRWWSRRRQKRDQGREQAQCGFEWSVENFSESWRVSRKSPSSSSVILRGSWLLSSFLNACFHEETIGLERFHQLCWKGGGSCKFFGDDEIWFSNSDLFTKYLGGLIWSMNKIAPPNGSCAQDAAGRAVADQSRHLLFEGAWQSKYTLLCHAPSMGSCSQCCLILHPHRHRLLYLFLQLLCETPFTQSNLFPNLIPSTQSNVFPKLLFLCWKSQSFHLNAGGVSRFLSWTGSFCTFIVHGPWKGLKTVPIWPKIA